jgi:uncharacterized DUF497 family protein
VNYEWDYDKAQTNLRKHGIDLADAVTVLDDINAITIPDNDHNEERFITLGMDAHGRILVVVYAYRDDVIRIISARKAKKYEHKQYGVRIMQKEYDFSQGKRGAVVPADPHKVRITIPLDANIVAWFKEQVHTAGGGNYQTLINDVLQQHISNQKEPLEEILRKVIREELHSSSLERTAKN